MATWNGSSWVHAPINLPGTPVVYSILCKDGNVFIGFNTSGTAYAAEETTVTNSGDGLGYPSFSVEWLGTGTSVQIEYLENVTTGARIWLNYSLYIGEKLTINFQPGMEDIISSFYGSVPRAVLRGSDMGEFFLLPGSNTIALFVSEAGSPSVEADLVWTPAYDNVDGAAV
jgi:hypothetical protein